MFLDEAVTFVQDIGIQEDQADDFALMQLEKFAAFCSSNNLAITSLPACKVRIRADMCLPSDCEGPPYRRSCA